MEMEKAPIVDSSESFAEEALAKLKSDFMELYDEVMVVVPASPRLGMALMMLKFASDEIMMLAETSGVK